MDQESLEKNIAELDELVDMGVLADDISQSGGEDCMYPLANSDGKWFVGITENAEHGDVLFQVYEKDNAGRIGLWGEHWNAADAIAEIREHTSKQEKAPAQTSVRAPQPIPVDEGRLYDLGNRGGQLSPTEAIEYKDLLQRHKEQKGRVPKWMLSWVNKNCKFANGTS